MFLDNSMSARCALYILVCLATPISVQPFCFSFPVSQTRNTTISTVNLAGLVFCAQPRHAPPGLPTNYLSKQRPAQRPYPRTRNPPPIPGRPHPRTTTANNPPAPPHPTALATSKRLRGIPSLTRIIAHTRNTRLFHSPPPSLSL